MNIEEAAARKLTERSLATAELREYLRKKGFADAEVKSVIEMLTEDGYLDDSRFCREYFGYAFSRNKGRNRVFAELRRKGVDEEVISMAFDDYMYEEGGEYDEKARAMAEVEKILRREDLSVDDPVPEKIRGRIGRKLDSYGYPSAIIYEILGELKR